MSGHCALTRDYVGGQLLIHWKVLLESRRANTGGKSKPWKMQAKPNHVISLLVTIFFRTNIMRVDEDNSYLNAIPEWIRGLLQRKQHHQGETAKNGNYRCPWLMASGKINGFSLSHSVHIPFFWKGTALHGSQGLQCVLLFAAVGSFSWCTSSLANPVKVPGIWWWSGMWTEENQAKLLGLCQWRGSF